MIFKYEAYNKLLRELGRLDYVIEINEIAFRDFNKKLLESDNHQDFIKQKSLEHGIMISYDSKNNLYNQIVLGYISQVYHATEAFFYEFQIEYNNISNYKWTFDAGVTKLDQIIAFFKPKGRFSLHEKIDDYLIDTFNYYHQLRIYFSHKKTTSKKEIEKRFDIVCKYFDDKLKKEYRISNSPKNIDDIDFEDFFLFTQVSKDLALRICSLCYPEPLGFASFEEIRELKKHMDNKERLEQSIENFLKTKFGFVKENDSDNLVGLIIDNL